jgi:transcription antitermination factor NusG
MIEKRKSPFNWYLLYTFPNHEKKVHKISNQKNISCFLPTQKIVRQWRDRKRILDVPLFPNYLFVYTTNTERLQLLDIPGASKFVSFEGKPVVLMEKVIETI